MNARKHKIKGEGPLVVGVDPAGKGADATAISWRRGSCIEKVQKHRGLSTMEVAGLVAKIIREDRPDKVSIDVGAWCWCCGSARGAGPQDQSRKFRRQAG